MPKKQKSGLYRTKIKIGVDAQGKDINKWVSGRTKAELETAKQEARAYYIDGTPKRDIQSQALAAHKSRNGRGIPNTDEYAYPPRFRRPADARHQRARRPGVA